MVGISLRFWDAVLWYLVLGEGPGTLLQYSCLENPMDGGAWWAAVHGVARSQTRLSDFTFIFHFHALEKEMATHSSVLAWRIPGTAEPSGLPSMGWHRVGHNWSDLAAVAVLIQGVVIQVLLLESWSKLRFWEGCWRFGWPVNLVYDQGGQCREQSMWQQAGAVRYLKPNKKSKQEFPGSPVINTACKGHVFDSCSGN